MSTKPGRSDRSWLAMLGVVLLPIVCCGLPVLIAAGGIGLVGSVLRNPYVIGAALLIVAGLVVWAVRRRAGGSAAKCRESESEPSTEIGRDT